MIRSSQNHRICTQAPFPTSPTTPKRSRNTVTVSIRTIPRWSTIPQTFQVPTTPSSPLQNIYNDASCLPPISDGWLLYIDTQTPYNNTSIPPVYRLRERPLGGSRPDDILGFSFANEHGINCLGF